MNFVLILSIWLLYMKLFVMYSQPGLLCNDKSKSYNIGHLLSKIAYY